MISSIFVGLKAYFGSLVLISRLKLWKYFAIPITISILFAILIFSSSWYGANYVGGWVQKLWFWEWGSETFSYIAPFIGGFVIIALGLILYKHAVMALSAPFMSPVSEKIEHYLIGKNHEHTESSFKEQLWRGVRINTRNLGWELLFTFPLLILKFIPIVNIFSTILLLAVQAYYAGFGNMDYTLERHFNYKESIQFVKKRKGLAIGNGIGFLLILLIPVFGLFLVLPLSVTAATRVTVDELHESLEK